MKTMTCKQLGGACDKEFRAETFSEIATMSNQHGMEMFQQKDPAHLEAMSNMQDIMKDPLKMEQWMDSKRKLFDSLPKE